MYYQGDYYQGDYYQGDPFFGALLGSVGGWVGKKLFKRGAKKTVGSAVARAGGGMSTAVMRQMAMGLGGGAAAQALMPRMPRHKFGSTGLGGERFQRGPVRRTIERILPGGRTGYETVGRKRMNVANPKALRRSLRRVAGFGKLACRARKDIQRAATAVGAGGSSRRRGFCPPKRKCA